MGMFVVKRASLFYVVIVDAEKVVTKIQIRLFYRAYLNRFSRNKTY